MRIHHSNRTEDLFDLVCVFSLLAELPTEVRNRAIGYIQQVASSLDPDLNDFPLLGRWSRKLRPTTSRRTMTASAPDARFDGTIARCPGFTVKPVLPLNLTPPQ